MRLQSGCRNLVEQRQGAVFGGAASAKGVEELRGGLGRAGLWTYLRRGRDRAFGPRAEDFHLSTRSYFRKTSLIKKKSDL